MSFPIQVQLKISLCELCMYVCVRARVPACVCANIWLKVDGFSNPIHFAKKKKISILSTMMMMTDVLRPPLCTWKAKWTERPPTVMKRSQR